MRAVVLTAGLALLAQAASSGTSRADAVSSTVVPTLVLSGTTEGAGTLQLGLDYRIPLGEAGNGVKKSIRLEPVFETLTSDGVSELFSGDGDGVRGPSSWAFGMTATYVEGQVLTGKGKIDVLPIADKLRLAERCMKENADFAGVLADARARMSSAAMKSWPSKQATRIKTSKDALTEAERDLLEARGTTREKEAVYEERNRQAVVAAATFAASKVSEDQARGKAVAVVNAASAKAAADEKLKLEAEGAARLARGDLDHARDQESVAAVNVSVALAAWEAETRAQWNPSAKEETQIWIDAVDSIGANDFCNSAVDEFEAAEEKEKRPSPARQLSFGVRMGRSEQTYLKLGAPVEGGDANIYAQTSKKNPRLSAGVSYTRLDASNQFTLEIPARFDLEYPSSGKKARWCTPAGMVTHPGDGGLDLAESCNEQPLGEPVRSFTTKAGAYVGYVAPDESWRIAAGFVSKVEMVDGDNPYEIGIEMPFYFFNTSPNYAGLVRVTPSALITRDADGKEDAKILVTLSLLGKRTLFTGALQ